MVLYRLGDHLTEALESSMDALAEMIDAYKLANENFSGQENDPDPVTICMGLQAQAIGVKVLCNWIDAVGQVAGVKFTDRATLAEGRLTGMLDAIGVVLPLP